VNIKRVLKKEKISLRDIQERSNLGYNTLSKLVNRKTKKIWLDTAIAFEDALDGKVTCRDIHNYLANGS
jgi:transcriptional regulator with XRE-family HTH domain